MWLLNKFLCLVEYKHTKNSVKLFLSGSLMEAKKKKKNYPTPLWTRWILIIHEQYQTFTIWLLGPKEIMIRHCHYCDTHRKLGENAISQILLLTLFIVFFLFCFVLFFHIIYSQNMNVGRWRETLYPFIKFSHGLTAVLDYLHNIIMCFINMISAWYHRQYQYIIGPTMTKKGETFSF